jgi:outer membrane biosynthesis protein TonB
MKRIDLRTNRGVAAVILLALVMVLILLIRSPAAGQYSSLDQAAPAEKAAALKLIEGSNTAHEPKQPPGLVGKPQNHLAPPETVPPIDAPPTKPQPGEVPPVIPPPIIKPKIPKCPQYYNGSDSTDNMYPCDPCVRPLTPDGTGPCLAP